MTAREIYDRYVNSYNALGERSYHNQKMIQQEMAEHLKENPKAKDKIYKLTLDWVNEIRTTKMKGQKPLDSLLPGRELEDNSCTIAKSLDEKYITCVGGSLLSHKDPYYNGPKSGENYFIWYAEWISNDDPNDFGWEELPWYAYLLARGFDMGAFPELSVNYQFAVSN